MRWILSKNWAVFVSADKFLLNRIENQECFTGEWIENKKSLVCVKFGWRTSFSCYDLMDFVNLWMSASSANKQKKKVFFSKKKSFHCSLLKITSDRKVDDHCCWQRYNLISNDHLPQFQSSIVRIHTYAFQTCKIQFAAIIKISFYVQKVLVLDLK